MGGPALWSFDNSANQTIDPDVYLAEGQAPPTLNNASRGMMIGMAKFAVDLGCAGTATRSGSNLYSLTTNQGFNAAGADRAHTVSFLVSAANTGPAQLRVDGQTARPLYRSSNRQLGPGDLTPDVLYVANFVPSLSVYVIVSPTIGRPGRIEFQATDDVDPGYLRCSGQAVSRSNYAALFSVIGTKYGNGDGSSTFNVPDGDGRTAFGSDNSKGRLTGAGGLAGALGSTGGTETHVLTIGQMPSHGHSASTTANGGHDHGGATAGGGSHNHGGATGNNGSHNHTGNTANDGAHTHTGTATGDGEHSHNIRFTRTAGFNTSTPNNGIAVTDITPQGGGNNSESTSNGGTHTHPLNINSNGAHNHTIPNEPAHNHTISTETNHTHTISAVPNHTHGVTIDSTGGGNAHPNIPPGFVGCFVIKA